MDRRFTRPLWILLLFSGCWLSACNEFDAQERERLIVDNARLSGELERARERSRSLELQLRALQEQQADADAAPTGAESTSQLLRTLAERDQEIEQLHRRLAESEVWALRYRHAGERAVEELNRDRSAADSRP